MAIFDAFTESSRSRLLATELFASLPAGCRARDQLEANWQRAVNETQGCGSR